MSEVDEYCEGLYIGLFSEAATCGAASSSMSGWATCGWDKRELGRKLRGPGLE